MKSKLSISEKIIIIIIICSVIMELGSCTSTKGIECPKIEKWLVIKAKAGDKCFQAKYKKIIRTFPIYPDDSIYVGKVIEVSRGK